MQKGHTLNYLLNLNETEKEFFIQSMIFEKELKIEFEEMKLKVINKMLGGE